MDKKPNPETSAVAKAVAKIEAEVRDGLNHGHFDLGISCRITNSGKRELVVKAGKNYRFLIPENELKQSA
jgi:hypothetical protein